MSIVQALSHNLTTAGTTQTTSAITTTAGNCLVFMAAYKSPTAGVVTPSDSTGLSWVRATGAPYSGGATGLTLDCWVARNITGNAANTFTFATTGADTPTIIIAEFSGRDLFVPVDFTLTASDTVAATGAHTTGTITSAGGDDLLAFNVSSALSQVYTSTGNWATPPNGTVTTATGYDAFVQYQNSANDGTNPNTYSVTVADKLDAFVIALKPPALPYSDEALDYFNEVPEVFAFVNSYQQADIRPQIADSDLDWDIESGETEAWALIESGSSGVIPSVVVAATNQYFGEDAELLDEVLELVTFTGGFQTQNFNAPLGSFNIDEPFDWFQEIDDEEWTFRDESNVQNGNVVATTSQPGEDLWEDEDPDDFFADDFGNDDADQQGVEPWDWFLTDEDDWAVDDNFLNINNPGALPLNIEDAWDHFPTDEDDWAIPDDYLNAPNGLLNAEDPTWWDEEPDQDDGTAHDLDPVVANVNPVICIEDPSDHWPTEDDEYFIVDEYALVDVFANSALNAEDPWDHFPTEDDEYFIVDEYALTTLVIAPSAPSTDGWDHWPTEDDDYPVPDDVAIIDVAPSTAVPAEDPWDHFPTEDDEYFIVDRYALVDNAPITVEDPWEHWLTDPDEEGHLLLDTDLVPVPQPAAIEDPTDWTQEADDEEWIFRNANPVGALVGLGTPTDGWDHFPTEDDDYAIPDDYAIIDVVVAPSQSLDDAWDWFSESAEDNDQDFAVTDFALPQNFYIYDPNFEVYMPQRNWVAMWLPTGLGTI